MPYNCTVKNKSNGMHKMKLRPETFDFFVDENNFLRNSIFKGPHLSTIRNWYGIKVFNVCSPKIHLQQKKDNKKKLCIKLSDTLIHEISLTSNFH